MAGSSARFARERRLDGAPDVPPVTAGRAEDALTASGAFALGALGLLGLLGIGRALALGLQGISVVPIDRARRLPEAVADLVFVLCFVLWVYEVIAFAWPLDHHLLPPVLAAPVVDWTPVRVLGAVVMAAGLVLYGLALEAFGPSWRLTIDREKAGALVTGGIFARTRNPIYLGLALLAAGSFLLLGRLVLLLLTLVFVAYFRHLIGREEAFLRRHYGEEYAAYCRRVGRLWTLRPGRR